MHDSTSGHFSLAILCHQPLIQRSNRDLSVTLPSSAHWTDLTFDNLFDVRYCFFSLMDSIATVGSGLQIRIIQLDAKISICKCMFVSQIVKRTEHGLLKISLNYGDLMFGLALIVFCYVKIARVNSLCIFSIIIAPALQTYCTCHADRATLALIGADDDDVWEKEERDAEKMKENSVQIVGDPLRF